MIYRDDDEIDLVALLLTLKRYLWLIILIVCAGTIGAYFYAKTLPSIYKARSVIFSPSKSSASGYMSALNSLGMGSLVSGGDTTPVDIIVKLLSSRRMAKDLIRQYDLTQYYQGRMSPRILSVLIGLNEDTAQGLLAELEQKGYLTPEGYTTAKFTPNRHGFRLALSKEYVPFYPQIVETLSLAGKHSTKQSEEQSREVSDEMARVVLERTIKILQGSLTVEKDKSSFITIGLEDRSPLLAALIVNSSISNLDLINEQLEITSQKPLVIVLDRAEKPTVRSKPNKKSILLIAVVTSLAGSVFLAFSIDFLRNLSRENK